MSNATTLDTEKSVIRPYAEIMRGWMTKHFGSEKHAAKTLADYASIPGYRDVSPRTTEAWKSGASPSESHISNDPVFCPSIL